MGGASTYDPLRLEQLLVQLEGALSSLEGLGPYVATVSPQQWLREVVSGVLKEVEDNLPDPDFFKRITSAGGKQMPPSQLVAHVGHCWELAFLMSIGRGAISMFIEGGKQPAGFATEQSRPA